MDIRKRGSASIFLIVGLVVFVVGFAIGRFAWQNPQIGTNISIDANVTPLPKEEAKNLNTYPSSYFVSPDRWYVASFSRKNSADQCSIQVSRVFHWDAISDKEFEDMVVPCTASMPGKLIPTLFFGWGDNDRLIIEVGSGKVKVFDINTGGKLVDSLVYDNTKYRLSLVSKDLTWLLVDRLDHNYNDPSSAAVLLDRSGNVKKEKFELKSDKWWGDIYDEVNNGIVFITVKCKDKGNDYRVYFYNLNNLTMKEVFSSTDSPSTGMGCVGNFLKPSNKKGEILLFPGCLNLESKYLDKNKDLRIFL